MNYLIFFLFFVQFSHISCQSPTKILMLISNGFDEISFSTSLNLLQRSGLSIEVVKVFEKDENLTDIRVISNSGGSYKAEFRFERIIEKMKEYLMIIIPDGVKHCQTISENQEVLNYLLSQKEKNYWISGIGASPALILAKGGIIKDQQLTCINEENCLQYVQDQSKINEKVVISNKIITGQNTGVVFEWSLTLLHVLQDLETAKEIANEIKFDYWEPLEEKQNNVENEKRNEEL